MKGISVILHVTTLAGADSLNNPVYEDGTVTVDNVLVGQPSTEEMVSSINLHGKHVEYVLGIPKGDEHVWEDAEVEFFGRKFRTFGCVVQGIEELVPTAWHKKVMVERSG